MGFRMSVKSVGLYVCYSRLRQDFNSEILMSINDSICEGDSIASKGRHYGELKVSYWIWKNAKEDIVGLFHYRRFLNLGNDDTKCGGIRSDFASVYGLQENRIRAIMNKYDIILPNKYPKIVKNKTPSVYDYYAREHCQKDMDVTLEVINEKYPHMYSLANKMLKEEKQSYGANIIIAKKNIFDEYAKWLFDILFEVENRIHEDVLLRDEYQQRVYGFISERLMAVFVEYLVRNKGIKVLEVPLLFVEVDRMKYMRYCIKKIKRKLLKLIGFGKKECNLYVK